MEFLGLNKDYTNTDVHLYVIKLEASKSKLLVNDVEYNFTINKNLEEKITIISDILENEENFSKLVINLSSANNSLLPHSYIISGSKIQNSYKENEREYFVDKNYYKFLGTNFSLLNIPLKFLHKFLLNSDYDIDDILNINLDEKFIIDNKLNDEELELFEKFNENHKHSITLKLSFNNNNLINSLFNNSYENLDNTIPSQIVFQKEVLNNSDSISFDNEHQQIIVNLNDNEFYQNACYLIKNVSIIEEFLKNNNMQNIDVKLPKIEKKEGCCGGGSCGAGSECCQNKSQKDDEKDNDEKEQPQSNGCCKNKPDSECCKKNSEIKCDKETCGNYESCCGTKQQTQEEKEAKIEEELKALYKNMNLNIDNPGFMLFLKGSKEEPKCKYSKPAVAKLNSIELDYNGYNILENEELRSTLKLVYPTYPQLYYNYKFVCGGDTINDKDHDSLKLFFEESSIK